MTTRGPNGTNTSGADSASGMVAAHPADPPHWRLWFWFLGLVFTGDSRAFRRLLVLLLLILAALISLALVAGPWAAPSVLALAGGLAGAHAVRRRHARRASPHRISDNGGYSTDVSSPACSCGRGQERVTEGLGR